MTASTRRAALGAILAAPLASVPAVAAASALPDHEVRFLALVPRLAEIVPRMERAKAYCVALREEADLAVGEHPGWADPRAAWAWSDRSQAARKRNGFRLAWEAWNERAAEIDEMVEGFMRQRMTTLRALAWKARVAELLDCWEDAAAADLAALAREGELCA